MIDPAMESAEGRGWSVQGLYEKLKLSLQRSRREDSAHLVATSEYVATDASLPLGSKTITIRMGNQGFGE